MYLFSKSHMCVCLFVCVILVEILIQAKFVTALVELGKSESEGTKEQVARVLLAFVEEQSHRGIVIAEVGVASC